MVLTKFNFSTLIFSALLTFNVNATMCTPSENDEFDAQIEIQESDNPVFTEETILSESEYISSVDESISSVAAETSELLDSTVMDTALITAEAVEAALGAIGIVIMVGMMIINVVEVFANPKSTTIDKIDAGVKFLVPIYGFLSTIINAFGLSPEDKVRAKVNDRISNSNNVYSYAPNSEEIKNFDALVLHAKQSLIKAINNTTVVREAEIKNDKILLRAYSEEYLLSIRHMRENLSEIYALQWMKASSDFTTLKVALKGAVEGEEITPPSIISSQTLTLCGVSDSNYFLSFSGKPVLQVKKCLDGIFYDYKTHFSTSSLDDIITVSAPDRQQTPPVETIHNISFGDFLAVYARSYNHFLSNIKLKYANSIYQHKDKSEKTLCLKQKNSAKEEFFPKVKAEALRMGRSMFLQINNVDGGGKSRNSYCTSHDGRYICSYLSYKPYKDSSLLATYEKLDALKVLIDDQYDNCLNREVDRDASHGAFISALNKDRFFPMLDEGDTSKLFSDIFRGIKSNLLFFVKQKFKISYEEKKKANIPTTQYQ
ncbi:hypothetical protein [uncultured Gammaproteobacteria bacterium]|nr:hypothetical protein [uncultured Gammaproteobacteria bacterium]